jgi:anaerobic selenocysteine-containing dehydrogenase
VLTTGRVAGQWHTRTKTGLVAELNKLDPAPYVRMNATDITRLDLHDGQFVEVQTRRGVTHGVLRADDTVPGGTVFLPMHWNDAWAHRASPNEATTDATDPISRQPALKACAATVRARRFTPPGGAETVRPARLPTQPESAPVS